MVITVRYTQMTNPHSMTNAISKVEPASLEWNARFCGYQKKTKKIKPAKIETRPFYDTGTLQPGVIK